jgi:rRNA maturation protein Nop10
MKIIHRIGLSAEPEVTDTLHSLEIAFGEPDSPLVRIVSFDIDESHRSWGKLQPLLAGWNASDIVRTEFSASERANATYLKVAPAWHHGYPQPEDDFGYLQATYDLKDYCPTCGIGKKQVAPFRIKGEPKWGKRHVLQLNWVFDEYLVLPSVWEEVFCPVGIGRLAVEDHQAGEQLRTVVQLEIKATAKSKLSMDDKYLSEICRSCGRTKFLPISRGFFPAFATDPSFQVCRTQEYFGSGASAWNAIVVSNAMYKNFQDHKLSGVTFVPLQPV